ncbi:EpsG family protein [Deferribacter thermophilus]|uniref:EpsG family protein n=1 Tax=Deferribacter thermophilus TaxID=53573 RepID=UPI003C2D03A2
MIFYFLYYISIAFLLFLDYITRNKKLFLYFCIFWIILISGTRYLTGYDFYNYQSYFYNYKDLSIEFLFKLSLFILNYFTSNSQFMFFIYSFFTIIIIFYAIKKYTKYLKTSFLIYLLIPGLYLNTFSIIRQGIAESILLLAFYYYIYRQNYLKFILFSLISILFHYSAIVPFIFLILFSKFLKKSYSISFYFLILFGTIFISQLSLGNKIIEVLPLMGRYVYYKEWVQEVNIIKIFVYNIFFCFFIIFKKNFIKNFQDNIMLNLLFFGIILLNIFSNYTPITRLIYYFVIFQIFLVPKLIYSFKYNSLKIVFLMLFIFYYFIMLFNSLFVDSTTEGNSNLIPYKNYFFYEGLK